MNQNSNPNKIGLTLSEQDIASLATWFDKDHPHLSPIGFRRLNRTDVEQAVRAWRQANGEPQLPQSDFWQQGSEWRQGPNFAGLDFAEQNLTGMDLSGVIFSYASLRKARLSDSSLKGVWFFRANLQGALVRRADLSRAKFFEADLSGAEFWRANLSGASFRGAVMEGTRLLEANLDGAYFHRVRMNSTELMAGQLGGSVGEERDHLYSRAVEAYSRLKANFESIGRYADAGWAYRKERRMRKALSFQQAGAAWRHKQQWQAMNLWLNWASDWLVELLCDYGESAWRVIGWMTFLLFVAGPGLLSLLGGLDWAGTNLEVYYQMPTTWQKWGYAYIQHVLYMLDIFTTANFSELKPHTDALKVISGLMTMAGIFLVGLLGFVAGNRIRNS